MALTLTLLELLVCTCPENEVDIFISLHFDVPQAISACILISCLLGKIINSHGHVARATIRLFTPTLLCLHAQVTTLFSTLHEYFKHTLDH